MRVNVYGEEYGDHRAELVTKVVDDEHTFYGIRLYLKFPNQEWWIHRKVDGQPDDDSSAVTIWGASKAQLRHLLHGLMVELSEDNVPVADGLGGGKFEENALTTFGYDAPFGDRANQPVFHKHTTSETHEDGSVTIAGPDAQEVADLLNDAGIPARVSGR